MSSNIQVSVGHLVTYKVVYPVMFTLGVVSNTISIVVLQQPALRSLQVKSYCLLLIWTDLCVYLSQLPFMLSDGGCIFHHRWFAEYFAHMGWAVPSAFLALSSYIIMWMALDRCLAVWWLNGYTFIKQPQVQKFRAITTASFCFAVNLPYMVVGEEVKCWNGTLSTEDSDCPTATWLLNDNMINETSMSVYLRFLLFVIILVPGVLLLASNLGLVAAILLGRVRPFKTTTTQQVKAVWTGSRAEITGDQTLAGNQEERISMSEGEQNNVLTGSGIDKDITLKQSENVCNGELTRAVDEQQVGTINKVKQQEELNKIFNEYHESPTEIVDGNVSDRPGPNIEHSQTPSGAADGRQTVLAGTNKKEQRSKTRNGKGWSDVLSGTWERNLVMTLIAMSTSNLILTTPFMIYLLQYTQLKVERCFFEPTHRDSDHINHSLLLLEVLLHPVFLTCLIPTFRQELCHILAQAASCAQTIITNTHQRLLQRFSNSSNI